VFETYHFSFEEMIGDSGNHLSREKGTFSGKRYYLLAKLPVSIFPEKCPLFLRGDTLSPIISQRKNDMFSNTRLAEPFYVFDEVIVRRQTTHEVESLAILGSGATGILTPASDYDLLVVFGQEGSVLFPDPHYH